MGYYWDDFNDESYLEHHGIKGQKWGVRRYQNKDGSLTNAGRKHIANSVKKYYDDDENRKSYLADSNLIKKNKYAKELHDSSDLTKARFKLKKLGSLMDDYDSSDDIKYKYKIKALAKLKIDGDNSTEKQLKGKYDKNNVWLMYEDWDQGYDSSVDLYLQDKGTNLKQYQKDTWDATDEYKKACTEKVQNLLGKYSNMSTKRRNNYESTKVSDALVDGLLDAAEEEYHTYYRYY